MSKSAIALRLKRVHSRFLGTELEYFWRWRAPSLDSEWGYPPDLDDIPRWGFLLETAFIESFTLRITSLQMLRQIAVRLSPQISQIPKLWLRTTAGLQVSVKGPLQPSGTYFKVCISSDRIHSLIFEPLTVAHELIESFLCLSKSSEGCSRSAT